MPAYKNFEQFARDLYLNSSEIEFDPRRTVDLAPTAFMRRAATTVTLFADGHSTKLGRAVRTSLPPHMKTDEDFMRYAIPKCLNLIDDERYFYSLMLVAAFIEELQYILYEKKKCYRFALSGYKCLTAVFKRKFEGGFEAHGGFKGLDKYFYSVRKCIDNRKKDYRLMTLLNGHDRELVMRVVGLMKNCCAALDQEFLLNDYELSVAEDLEASKELWFNPAAAVVEDESPFKFDCHVEFAMNETKTDLEYVYDKTEDKLEPAGDVPDLTIEDLTSENEFPDSDIDTSDSESESGQNFYESMGNFFLNVTKPDEFNRLMNARECKFCGTYCYQYGLYKFHNHAASAVKVKLPIRWLRTAAKVVGYYEYVFLEKLRRFLRGLR